MLTHEDDQNHLLDVLTREYHRGYQDGVNAERQRQQHLRKQHNQSEPIHVEERS